MFDTLINAGIYLLGFTRCRRLQVFSALVLIFKKKLPFFKGYAETTNKEKEFSLFSDKTTEFTEVT